MSNDYYTHGSYPAAGAAGSSASMRAELDSVMAGFDKLPGLTGNANKLPKVNGSGNAMTMSIISDDGTIATVGGALAVSGAASAASLNKVTITAPASGATLTIADGKTLTSSNTITLAGTDGTTLNIGGGGTLGSAAFTPSTAYLAAGGTAANSSQLLGATWASPGNIGTTAPGSGAFTALSASTGLLVTGTTSDSINPIATTNQIRLDASGFAAFRMGTAHDFNIDVYNSATPINVFKITQAGAASFNYGLSVAGSLIYASASGYTTGAGGTVTQATSKATGVTLNKACGEITMNAAALAANTTVSFTLTNSVIAAADVIAVHRKSGGTAGAYQVWIDSVAAGSCVVCVRNISAGSLSEAVLISFAVTKGATA